MFPPEAELWFDWHLTNRCNFDCDYCHPQIKHVLNRKNLNEPSVEECVAAFDRMGASSGILMSGGEPFAFPGFVQLCRGLTRNHYIAINTNMSMTEEIEDFARVVAPARVSRILAAIHVEERRRNGLGLEDFARNYQILREAGFDITAAYVLHPTLLDQAPADFDFLRRAGVDNLVGKVFKGIWEKRRFPTQYNDHELEVVRSLITNYKMGSAYLDREWDFRGLACRSGLSSFKITVTGDVRRCVSVPTSFGNFFDGSFQRGVESTACTARHIRVLSECVEHLEARPAELSDLLTP